MRSTSTVSLGRPLQPNADDSELALNSVVLTQLAFSGQRKKTGIFVDNYRLRRK